MHIHPRRTHPLQLRLLFLTLALCGAGAGTATASGETPWQQQPVTSGDLAVPDNADVDRAEQRLNDILSTEMLDSFNLFIYIDKAEDGTLAQRMIVFEKTDNGDLAPLYDWPVSTGRARDEIDPHGQWESTATPRGFFEFDPKRMFVDHSSSQWDEAMPYAMFFNWKPGGHDTGLAIHGTPDENYDELGSPASAGCIRLSVENARVLFDLVHAQRGPAPKLAYLDDGSVSSEGLLLHDAEGRLELYNGYSALVLIDDYAPGERVSSLY